MPMTHAEIAQALRAYILRDILQQPDLPLADDTPLISSGLLDSLALGRVAVFIEDRYGVYISDMELTAAQMDTLAQFAARVLRR